MENLTQPDNIVSCRYICIRDLTKEQVPELGSWVRIIGLHVYDVVNVVTRKRDFYRIEGTMQNRLDWVSKRTSQWIFGTNFKKYFRELKQADDMVK